MNRYTQAELKEIFKAMAEELYFGQTYILNDYTERMTEEAILGMIEDTFEVVTERRREAARNTPDEDDFGGIE